jgi:hypothetical protein
MKLKTLISAGWVLLSASAGFAQASTPVFINEIHYDNTGTDVGEAIEIAGPAGTDLSSWSLVLYNGSNGAKYATYPLSGSLADSGNGFGFVAINTPGIQNGSPDGIALINANGQVVQFLSYEGVMTAVDGAAAGTTSVDIGVTEDGTNAVGTSLQLTGSGSYYESFTWVAPATNTFGNVNTGQSFSGVTPPPPPPPPQSTCGQAATLISAIQGTTDTSPLVNQTVTIEGIVTATFQAAGQLNGFFVEEETAQHDNDPQTSEGVFVYNTSNAVQVGDLVRFNATVAEYNGLTELKTLSSFSTCATGQALPAPSIIQLPNATSTALEAVEGMRVQVSSDSYVADNYNLARYGQFYISASPRLSVPTNVVAPGAPAIALAVENKLNLLLVDDSSNTQDPATIRYPEPSGLSANDTLRVGTKVNNIVGVIDYSFGEYRLQPTQQLGFDSTTNPRSSQPNAIAGARLTVGSFNVLNYFNGDGLGGGFPTARGANTAEEFTRQYDKIANAINVIQADVMGLMEIENDGFDANSAITQLTKQINDRSALNHYAYINPGLAKIGTDEITVGLIYRSDKVTPVGKTAILSSANSPKDSNNVPLFDDTKSRPMLTQTFFDKASGAEFTVAVNHLKSKGSDCNEAGDPDIGDGQGNCNITRTKAAQALTKWLATKPTGSSTDNTLIIGDLNSYAKEDPITTIKNAGYVDQVERFDAPEDRYSYVYSAESGYLDHALASKALSSQIVGTTHWHINADEPRALDYNEEYKTALQIQNLYSPEPYRASDHDPVVIGLALTRKTLLPTPTPTPTPKTPTPPRLF